MSESPSRSSPLAGEELRRRYREGLPTRMEVLEDALSRLSRDEGAEEVIRRMAHVLRGSGTSYGYPGVTERAGRAEEASREELAEACRALLEELRGVAEPGPPEERAVILVVEDDPEIRYLLEVVLGGDDREVLAVDRAGAARAVLDARPVDLVLLDLVLPDADGRALLTHIRERPRSSRVPVVVISAYDAPGIEAECFSLGCDAFFRKPFDAGTLEAAVSAHLSRMARRDLESRSDPVTGLLNRAGLLQEVDALDDGSPRALTLVELDDFDRVERRHGWAARQAALKAVAGALEAVVAAGPGRVARWEGGTFALLVPGGLEEVRPVAKAAVDAVRRCPVEGPDGETFRLTASAGMGVGSGSESTEELMDRARSGVYRARAEGGNRVGGDSLGGRRKRKIMVAEDDDITASLLRHRLERDGFEVEWHANGTDAYEAVLEGRPDLVILDVRMPGMDGFELLERLRKVPSLQEMPVVLLTSLGSEADLVRGFRLGADDYVLKPFSPIEFVARIRRLVSRRP